MKTIAFLASPRKGGNTEILLREAIRGIASLRESSSQPNANEVEIFDLNIMNIRPCQDCGMCTDTGVCTIDDDMTQIYNAIRSADRIILASPIFFFSLSAQAKIMIDRCQSFWCEKYLLKKSIPAGKHGRKGLLMLVGGMKKDIGTTCAEATAKAFFRTISVPEHKTLSFLGVDAKGEILKHPTATKEAFEAGEKLACF